MNLKSKIFESSCFIILEAGVNHNGQLSEALELVRAAARAGANAVKFQTYTAEKLAAPLSPSYWNLSEEATTSQIELFKKYDGFNVSDYLKIANECSENGIEFMTTCFDEDWVDKLNPVLRKFKIASADITNHPLIRKVASKGKPILLSTGASTMTEIEKAVAIIRDLNSAPLCVMHCVLNYPTEYRNANLGRISELSKMFPDLEVGYSDHTRPEFSQNAIIQAMNLGATTFEKHFTLDKSQAGNDHYHSFDEADVINLMDKMREASEMRNYTEDRFIEVQKLARSNARRGIYARRPIRSGTVISWEDLVMLRPIPDNGISSADADGLIGKTISHDVKTGELIKFNSIT
jgi:sialic acid synthase SpsE